MDFGGFINNLGQNLYKDILDPASIITSNAHKLSDSYIEDSANLSKSAGKNIQNLTGSKKGGLMGVSDVLGDGIKSITEINPLFLGVAGVGLLAVLVIAVRI